VGGDGRVEHLTKRQHFFGLRELTNDDYILVQNRPRESHRQLSLEHAFVEANG
jgi:hypothetical protein